MVGRNSTILNSIIDRTAGAMSQSIYQSALSQIALNGTTKTFNTVENTLTARGEESGIICGESRCGHIGAPEDGVCKFE
jgi:hypothetical protein